jgi:hypothetical protein
MSAKIKEVRFSNATSVIKFEGQGDAKAFASRWAEGHEEDGLRPCVDFTVEEKPWVIQLVVVADDSLEELILVW